VTTMRLRVTVPLEPLVDTEVSKVTAEAVDGWFCLLPRHIDLVTALVAGVLVYEDPAGQEAFVAIDESVLVKCGEEVLVSTPRAVTGSVLGELQAAVAEQFRRRDEREVLTRAAVRKLEATFLRGLMDLEEVRRG
jgi:F-type H+-transporting ATPase subunit epsilon